LYGLRNHTNFFVWFVSPFLPPPFLLLHNINRAQYYHHCETMARRKSKRPGAGAKASSLTRINTSNRSNIDPTHRSNVVLERICNRNNQVCYSFRFDGVDAGKLLFAARRHFTIL
jgi:hypothetical protein